MRRQPLARTITVIGALLVISLGAAGCGAVMAHSEPKVEASTTVTPAAPSGDQGANSAGGPSNAPSDTAPSTSTTMVDPTSTTQPPPASFTQLGRQRLEQLIPPGSSELCKANALALYHVARGIQVGSDGTNWNPSLTPDQTREARAEITIFLQQMPRAIDLLNQQAPDQAAAFADVGRLLTDLSHTVYGLSADQDPRIPVVTWVKEHWTEFEPLIRAILRQCPSSNLARFMVRP